MTQGQFWLGALQNSGATSFGHIELGDLDLSSTLSYTSSLNTWIACCLVNYYSAVYQALGKLGMHQAGKSQCTAEQRCNKLWAHRAGRP